ncbi:MAG: hypothetical protein HY553_16200 [Elusimicrobia bacterium]|nr:hypothetical protein [Elusimicrobiota bacterium]
MRSLWLLLALAAPAPAAAEAPRDPTAAVGAEELERRAGKLAERLLLAYRRSELAAERRRLTVPELEEAAPPGAEAKTAALAQLIARDLSATTYFVALQGFDPKIDDVALRVGYFNLEDESIWVARLVRPRDRVISAVASDVVYRAPVEKPLTWFQRLRRDAGEGAELWNQGWGLEFEGGAYSRNSHSGPAGRVAVRSGRFRVEADLKTSSDVSFRVGQGGLRVAEHHSFFTRRFALLGSCQLNSGGISIPGLGFPEWVRASAGFAYSGITHTSTRSETHSPTGILMPTTGFSTAYDRLDPAWRIALGRTLNSRVAIQAGVEYVHQLRPIEPELRYGGLSYDLLLGYRLF